MNCDEGLQFRELLVELASIHDVAHEKSIVEAYRSLKIGERYSKPLRDIHRKLKLYSSLQLQVLLVLYIKSINDTLGPEGIIPSASVFEKFSSIRSILGYVFLWASLEERAEVAQEVK